MMSRLGLVKLFIMLLKKPKCQSEESMRHSRIHLHIFFALAYQIVLLNYVMICWFPSLFLCHSGKDHPSSPMQTLRCISCQKSSSSMLLKPLNLFQLALLLFLLLLGGSILAIRFLACDLTTLCTQLQQMSLSSVPSMTLLFDLDFPSRHEPLPHTSKSALVHLSFLSFFTPDPSAWLNRSNHDGYLPKRLPRTELSM